MGVIPKEGIYVVPYGARSFIANFDVLHGCMSDLKQSLVRPNPLNSMLKYSQLIILARRTPL